MTNSEVEYDFWGHTVSRRFFHVYEHVASGGHAAI